MWLSLAFLSAALLGLYDVAKKKSLSGNAVLPVLLLNTLFSSLLFLPAILSAELGLDGSTRRRWLPRGVRPKLMRWSR